MLAVYCIVNEKPAFGTGSQHVPIYFLVVAAVMVQASASAPNAHTKREASRSATRVSEPLTARRRPLAESLFVGTITTWTRLSAP
jgi:hypothetical protein